MGSNPPAFGDVEAEYEKEKANQKETHCSACCGILKLTIRIGRNFCSMRRLELMFQISMKVKDSEPHTQTAQAKTTNSFALQLRRHTSNIHGHHALVMALMANIHSPVCCLFLTKIKFPDTSFEWC